MSTNVLRPGTSGVVKFKINYWNVLNVIYSMTAKVRYDLQAIEPELRVEMRFLSGPTYT